MITRDQLCADLSAIGVIAGQRIEVHSSLRAIGWVDGGAATVVQSLMDVVTPTGTLVMSAYPLSKPLPLTAQEQSQGIVAKVRLYDVAYRGASGMGAIADAFRDHPQVYIGHRFHRVATWGDGAERYLAGYQALYDDDGWVLLIGVDITRMSSMHLAEEGIFVPHDPTTAIPFHIAQQYPANQWYVQYQAPGTSAGDDEWLMVQAIARAHGWIYDGFIGCAPSMFLKVRPVIDVYRQRLLRKSM